MHFVPNLPVYLHGLTLVFAIFLKNSSEYKLILLVNGK